MKTDMTITVQGHAIPITIETFRGAAVPAQAEVERLANEVFVARGCRQDVRDAEWAATMAIPVSATMMIHSRHPLTLAALAAERRGNNPWADNRARRKYRRY